MFIRHCCTTVAPLPHAVLEPPASACTVSENGGGFCGIAVDSVVLANGLGLAEGAVMTGTPDARPEVPGTLEPAPVVGVASATRTGSGPVKRNGTAAAADNAITTPKTTSQPATPRRPPRRTRRRPR